MSPLYASPLQITSEESAPSVQPCVPEVPLETKRPKKKGRAKNPCPSYNGTGSAESQQKIGFQVDEPKATAVTIHLPGLRPIPNPLPHPVARAIALHRILESFPGGGEVWCLWKSLHREARGLLEGDHEEIYRRYEHIRHQSLYGPGHFAGDYKQDTEINGRAMTAARNELNVLLQGMPSGDDELRLHLTVCQDVVALARQELDRAEAFLAMAQGLWGGSQ